MTEEDTYNKLRRIDFELLFTNKAMIGFYAVSLLGGRRKIPEDLKQKMTAGGWTEEEFLEEIDRRFTMEYVINEESSVVERKLVIGTENKTKNHSFISIT